MGLRIARKFIATPHTRFGNPRADIRTLSSVMLIDCSPQQALH